VEISVHFNLAFSQGVHTLQGEVPCYFSHVKILYITISLELDFLARQ